MTLPTSAEVRAQVVARAAAAGLNPDTATINATTNATLARIRAAQGGTGTPTPTTATAPTSGTFAVPSNRAIDTAAVTAAGSPARPPSLTAPASDTIGLLNQYLYVKANPGAAPAGSFFAQVSPSQVDAQIVQLTASALNAGSAVYGGYTLDSSTVRLAQSLNQGNRYALTPSFAQALQTGQPGLFAGTGVGSVGPGTATAPPIGAVEGSPVWAAQPTGGNASSLMPSASQTSPVIPNGGGTIYSTAPLQTGSVGGQIATGDASGGGGGYGYTSTGTAGGGLNLAELAIIGGAGVALLYAMSHRKAGAKGKGK